VAERQKPCVAKNDIIADCENGKNKHFAGKGTVRGKKWKQEEQCDEQNKNNIFKFVVSHDYPPKAYSKNLALPKNPRGLTKRMTAINRNITIFAAGGQKTTPNVINSPTINPPNIEPRIEPMPPIITTTKVSVSIVAPISGTIF